MSSSSDRSRASMLSPRVGIVRGVVPSREPVRTNPKREMPTEVLDPVALQAMREDAEQEGYAAGYQAGLEAAHAEAQQVAEAYASKHQAAQQALLTAAQQLRAHQVQALEHVADQTALLALRIAEIVLQREVTTAENPGREAITRALDLVPDSGTLQIRLNPADLEVLGDLGELLPGRDVDLVADATVTSGGCVLQVGATRIDAQIPSALGRVAEVLR